MERPTRPKAKVPSPITKDYSCIGYFDNTGDGGIRVIGAALSLDPQTHIIIVAPDAVSLRRAWESITTQPLDVKKSQILLCKYETPLEKLGREQLKDFEEELKTKVSKVKHEDYSNPWLWFIHPESDSCFIEEKCTEGRDPLCVELGPAIDCTVDECRLLLRKEKVSRSIIESLTINTDTSTLIPF